MIPSNGYKGMVTIFYFNTLKLEITTMKLTPLEPFVPREGERIPFNPFHHDMTAVGTRLSEELYIMQYNFSDQPLRSAYLVNVRTGERCRLEL